MVPVYYLTTVPLSFNPCSYLAAISPKPYLLIIIVFSIIACALYFYTFNFRTSALPHYYTYILYTLGKYKIARLTMFNVYSYSLQAMLDLNLQMQLAIEIPVTSYLYSYFPTILDIKCLQLQFTAISNARS